jgi:hypothetical protein
MSHALAIPLFARERLPENLFALLSAGRRIGLSLDTRVVAGSNPAPGSSLRSSSFGWQAKCPERRSAERVGGQDSSVVEHVIPSSFFIRRFTVRQHLSGPKTMGYRNCWLAVQIRPPQVFLTCGVAQMDRAAVKTSMSLLARLSTSMGRSLWVIACYWFDSSGRLKYAGLAQWKSSPRVVAG